VSVRVEAGEVVGLLGPNGAGKTTTFSMVGRARDARRGRGPPRRRGRHDAPDVPPRAARPRLPAAGAVDLPADDRRREPPRHPRDAPRRPHGARETAHGLLDRFKLSHLAHSVADTLSGGERRRLEIARALTLSPRFILLDEPFAGIDPITVLDLQQVIRDLAAAGIGILITDHNVRDTLAIVSRAYIIHSGTIFKTGSPETLSADPEVRRVYLGETFRLD
jgi:lipopolysaccharide export system ATP-binding protein